MGVLLQSLWEPCTVNVDIFAHYISSRISRMVFDARKYDVSGNLNRYSSNGINN